MVSQEALERQASRQLAQEGAAAAARFEACFSTREVCGWRQRQERERGPGGAVKQDWTAGTGQPAGLRADSLPDELRGTQNTKGNGSPLQDSCLDNPMDRAE